MDRQFSFVISCLLSGLFLLFTTLQTASAQVEKNTQWRDAVVTDLDVDFGGTGFHARWRFHHCECGDLQVMVEQIAPDDILTGELLMIDGQALLARGFEQQGEDIEPLIQAPSLMLQLAYSMLNRSQPKGPAAVTGKQTWESFEKSIDFRLDTGLATGMFAAPWSVKGSGWEASPGKIRFELLFEFTSRVPGQADETGSITLSGEVDFNKREFPYPDDTSLEGWRVQWLSLNELKSVQVEKGITLKTLRDKAKDQ
jgi:hypothetical protein